MSGTGMSNVQNEVQALPEPSISALKQTMLFRRDPFALMSEARTECGDIFALRLLGLGRWVVLASTELLNELYRMPEDKVVAGEIRGRLLARMVGPKASISIDGEEYARRRRVTTPYFTGRKVFAHTGTIRGLTEAAVAGWPTLESFALQPHLDDISLRVAAEILWGPADRPAIEELIEISRRFLRATRSPFVLMRALQWNLGRLTPWGRFRAIQKQLFAAIEKEVRRRASGGPSPADDVINAMIAEYGTGNAAVEVIVQEVGSFVIGGAETTSKTISWTMAGLLAHADAARRIRREIEEVVGDEPLEAGHLRQLPYLHAVVQEGIRTAQVGPFAGPRWTLEDIRLGDYAVPRGVTLVQCLPQMGQSDLFLHRDTFEPANFLERKIKTSDWVPFGGGSRICTGMGLAQLELAVVVATIVRSADLELVTPNPRPVPMGIAYQPENGLQVRMLARRCPKPPASRPAADPIPASTSTTSQHSAAAI